MSATMRRTVRAYVGPCLCEHVCHETTPEAIKVPGHSAHKYGARRLLTHHVRQITGDVCAPCAAAIRGAYPEEVTPL